MGRYEQTVESFVGVEILTSLLVAPPALLLMAPLRAFQEEIGDSAQFEMTMDSLAGDHI